MATIGILGTLDTKGVEHAFVAAQIRARGHETLVIDVGTIGEPGLKPDITRSEVTAAAGIEFSALAAKRDRGEAVAGLGKGAPLVGSQLVATGGIPGLIFLCGGGGGAGWTA